MGGDVGGGDIPSLITVNGEPACVRCEAIARALGRAGVAYRYVDLNLDAEALASVQGLGYRSAPALVARS